MTPFRSFSHDVPSNVPIARRAQIRASFDAQNYVVDLGDGMPQRAYWYGQAALTPGQQVTGFWSPESHTYVIRGVAAGSAPTAAGA